MVIECTALYHDVAAQFGGIGKFDDFIEGVFDDGVGKTCGNIGNGGTLFLRLFHIGVHKHGAASAQINRILGKEGFFCKVLGSVVQRVGEILDKTAAAGGTGLVEQDGVYKTVAEFDTLHVLPADVQHAVHLRVKERGGCTVGNGLHFALIKAEGGFKERFSVACGASAKNHGVSGELFFQLGDGLNSRLNGISAIVGIERPQELTLFADQRQLCGG